MHNELARHFQFYRFIHSRYNDLVIADTLRQVAISLIAIFVPIYLLDLGFALGEVFSYWLVLCLAQALATYLFASRISRFDIKRALILSYLLNAAVCLALFAGPVFLAAAGSRYLLLFLGLLSGAELAIFATAHHFYFFAAGNGPDRGSRAGLLAGAPVLFAIAGPFLGGYLIVAAGWPVLFAVSAAFFFLAAAALFLSPRIGTESCPPAPASIIDAGRPLKNWLYFFQGTMLAAFTLSWPLIMYFLGLSFVGIGLVFLLANAVHGLACYWAGRYSDKNGSRGIIQYGLLFHGATLAGRGLAATAVAAGAWTFLGGIFGAMNAIPLEADFYRYAKKSKDYVNSHLNRELYLIGGKLFLGVFLVLALSFLGGLPAMRASMFAAAIAALAMVVLASRDRDLIA